MDHWTTFGAAEAKAASEAGYLRLRSLGWAPNASHAAGTANASKAVYLYYSLFRHDHFSSPEAVAPHGYLAKGRQGYLLSGTDPLPRPSFREQPKCGFFWDPEPFSKTSFQEQPNRPNYT